MRLAIVGSVKFANPRGEALVRSRIEAIVHDLYPGDVVVSGGAHGVDSWAHEAAAVAGFQVVNHFPENPRWEPRGYKARNLLIAQDCDALVRIYCAKSRTYGSGWTADRAHEMGKPVVWFKLPVEGSAFEWGSL